MLLAKKNTIIMWTWIWMFFKRNRAEKSGGVLFCEEIGGFQELRGNSRMFTVLDAKNVLKSHELL